MKTKNVLGFKYKSAMPNADQAIERQLNNLIGTFGRDAVLATLKRTAKLAKAG